MKLTVVLLVTSLLAGFWANAETFDKRSVMLRKLKVGDCFSNVYISAGQYSFEKPYIETSRPFVVMAIDGDGYMIAQPRPEHETGYWFRTVDIKEPYLVFGDEKIFACPKGLTRADMIKVLHNSKEFNPKYQVK